MKLLIVVASVLFASFLEAADVQWKPKFNYTFEYYGHQLGTVENIGNRKTGLAINISVSILSTNERQFMLQINRFRQASIDANLKDVDEKKILWDFQKIPPYLKTSITMPVRALLRNGDIESVEVSKDDLDESLNIKLAILSLLRLNMNALQGISMPLSISSQQKQNLLPNSLKSDFDDVNVTFVMEDGVAGNCETTYLVSREPSPFRPRENVLNVTKKINFNRCEKKPFWIRTSLPPNKCAQCEANDMNPVTTVTSIDYDIKKVDNEVRVEKILSESYTMLKPFTGNFDYFSFNHSQIVELKMIRPIIGPLPNIINPEIRSTIQFVFPTAARKKDTSLKAPLTSFFYDGKFDALREALESFDDFAYDVVAEAQYSKFNKSTPLLLYNVIRAIRQLNLSQIETFFKEATIVKEMSKPGIPPIIITEFDRKQMATEILAMSGSSPAIVHLKFLIESQQLSETVALQAIQILPTNIFEPTYELQTELLALAKHDILSRPLRAAAFLALGIVVKKACSVQKLPLPPYIDNFCPPNVRRQIMTDISSHLKSADSIDEKLLFLRILGLTELPEAIPFILPYASGEEAGHVVIQAAALKVLKMISVSAPLEVRRIALTEFFDTKNPKFLRIVALRTALYGSPDYSDLQTIATWLIKERSDDVAGYIVSYFRSMGNASHYCLDDLANGASQLLSFIDEELDNGIQGSNVFEWSQTFDKLGLSAQTTAHYIASNNSIIPDNICIKTNFSVGGYSYEPFQVSLQMQGLQTIINRLIGPIANFKKYPSLDEIFEPEEEEEQINSTQINKQLNLKPRLDDPLLLSAFIKVGDTQTQMFYLDNKTVVDFIRKRLSGSSKFQTSLHMHRLPLLVEVMAQFPSTLGIAQSIELIQPSFLTLLSNLSVVTDMQNGPTVEAKLFLKPSLMSQNVVRLSVYNPFLMQVNAVGVQTFTYGTMPIVAQLGLDLKKGVFKTSIKPSVLPQFNPPPLQDIRLAKYKVEPYSLIYFVNTTKDIGLDLNIIHRVSKPVRGNISLAAVGLPLNFSYISELQWPDKASFLSYLREFNGLISFMTTAWKFPEFALRKYQLIYNRELMKDHEINTTFSWTFTPTQTESAVIGSETSGRGIWPIFAGFARLPQRCGSRNEEETVLYRSSSVSSGSSDEPSPQKIYPSKAEQYTRNEVAKLDLKLGVVIQGISKARFNSSLSLERNLETLEDKFSFTLDLKDVPLTQSDKFKVCSNGSIKYPSLPCDIKSLVMLQNLKPAQFKLGVSWGTQDQCSSNPQIAVEGTLEKSSEQRELEQEKKRWYYGCLTDVMRGKELMEECRVLISKLTSFNQVQFLARFERLPPLVQNATFMTDSFLKASLYYHMSNNPIGVNNGEGRLRVKAFIYDSFPAFDLQLFKPSENTFFTKVPVPFPYVYSISAKENIMDKFLDDITDGQAWVSSKFMGDNVTTFDNDTLVMPLSSCQHVLVKDCSLHDLFAVTMNNKKEMNVFVLSHVIQIKSRQMGTSSFVVNFDNRILKPTDSTVVAVKTGNPAAPNRIVAVFVTTGPLLHVLLPLTGVTIVFNGQNAEITITHLWKGRVCGLSSEFQGDTLDDLVGPDQCLYPDPASLSISYGLPSYTCRLPRPPNPNKTCDSDIDVVSEESEDSLVEEYAYKLKPKPKPPTKRTTRRTPPTKRTTRRSTTPRTRPTFTFPTIPTDFPTDSTEFTESTEFPESTEFSESIESTEQTVSI